MFLCGSGLGLTLAAFITGAAEARLNWAACEARASRRGNEGAKERAPAGRHLTAAARAGEKKARASIHSFTLCVYC